MVAMCAERKRFSCRDQEWVDSIEPHIEAVATFVKVMPPLDAIGVWQPRLVADVQVSITSVWLQAHVAAQGITARELSHC